jgi:predicted dehydrogenase
MADIGIGMLGQGFMGRAHARALRTLTQVSDPPVSPRLVALAGRDTEALEVARRRFGFERTTTDWRDMVADPHIGLLENLGPNRLHAEPVLAAVDAGMHVLCEKPLGMDAAESHAMWAAAHAAGVVHMCAFNYRFVPAVRRARELMEAGALGEIRHVRARYLQAWGDTTDDLWRFDAAQAGSGALGDLGAHIIDLARYLVGEPHSVSAHVARFVAGREVDDAFAAAVTFAGGATGTLEATRFATGRVNALEFEINGSEGALAFDLERLNELRVADAPGTGFRTELVTGPATPFGDLWWPPGHVLGWEHTFVHELDHLLRAIAGEHGVAPHGATFEDGYRAAEVCDAIVRSDATGRREEIAYRDLHGVTGPAPSAEA